MIIIMIVAVGLFMMVPVFVDYASLHYTRRVTQTGADAAALAAAIEYADHFSIDWPYGDSWLGVVAAELCCFGQLCMWNWDWSQMCSSLIYVLYVYLDGNDDSIGDGEADDYADKNGTRIKEYAAAVPPFTLYELPRIHFMKAMIYIPVPPVSVEVETERRAQMIYGNLYGRNDFWVHAHARAEAYMEKYETRAPMPCLIICCSCNPYGCICISQTPSWHFEWKVRLVE
jgi:hypothetical protein